MKRKFTFLIAAAIMLLTMVATTERMWGQTRAEGDTHVFSQSLSQLLNNNASIASIEIAQQSYSVKKVTISYRYNKTLENAVTMEVSVNGTSWGSEYSVGTGNNYTTVDFEGESTTGPIVISFTNNTGSGTGHGTFYVNNVTLTEGASGGGNTPSISANNVNIAYNATNGSIGYTLNNATGNVTAAVTTGDWLTLGEITSSAVPFTCSANTSTTSTRTATVTLTFTGATDKVVTVTQGKAPITIAEARTQGTGSVLTQGVVTSCVGTTGYIQDNTAAICVYGTSLTIGDDIVVSGTLSDYNSLLEITSPQVTVLSSGNTVTPTVKTIAEINSDYAGDNELQGWLVKIENATVTAISGSGNSQNTTIAQSTNTIVVRGNPGVDLAVNDVLTSIVGNIGCYNAAQIANPRDVVVYHEPEITATPSPFTAPSYVFGTAEPTYNVLTVNGSNLTANISLVLNENSNFEMSTDLNSWTNSLMLTQSNGSVTNAQVAIRLKAGLQTGNYNGSVTLSSTGATNVVVNLTGSVANVTYSISVENQITGGTIEADKASAAEGETVTLTAHPDAAYTFSSWTVLKDDLETPVSVTNNQFTMPACQVYVTATFNAKPTYAITKVVTPDNSGTIETDNTAWEGKTVTVLVEAANGYSFSSIVISKTGDPETTISTTGNAASGFTFTMPGYAVTATATFISNTFEGSFVKVTTLNDLEDDGYYILVFNSKAMNSTLTSGRMGAVELTITDNIITDPDRSIVWKLEENGDNWDLYSEKEGKYCYIDGNTTSSFVMEDEAGYSFVVTRYNDGGFKFLSTDSNERGIYQLATQYASYAASNNPEVYLYKYTILTERTITFNGNGGETDTHATTYTQTVYDGIEANLRANEFTKENSAFAGWALTADGDVEYDDEAAITVTGDNLYLYAIWVTSYTATVDNNIEGGTVIIVDGSQQGATSISAAAGATITLSATPDSGYGFDEWNVYKSGDQSTTVTVTENAFTMPEYDVIVSATFVEATTYSLLTNVNQIISGKHYIIASGTAASSKAIGQQNTNNRAAVTVTVSNISSNYSITETTGVYEFVINGPDNSGNYTIYDVVNKGYLYAAGKGSGNNFLKTQSDNDSNGLWSLDINTTTGAATVIAQGSNTNNYMRFNNTLFSCYSSSSSIQNPVYFYMKENDTDLEFYGNNTCDDLTIAATETLTVTAGSTLTVTGDLTNNGTAANLVIEDGGQLIHTAAVNATVQRNITAASSWKDDVDGWHFIASPVDGVATSVVAIGSYDLFAYDEETAMWWVDHAIPGQTANHTFTTLERGKGYLYANAAGQTFDFAGLMGATDELIEKDLSYAYDGDLKGFNLMGNPFTRNLTTGDMKINTTAVTSYYGISDDTKSITARLIASKPIKPGEGFMVQVNEENKIDGQNKLYFNPAPAAKDEPEDNGYISIVAGNENSIDNAFIQIGNGNTLRKMNISNGNKVYVMNGDKDYAAARIDEANGTMPVHFEAAAEGTYTITVEATDLDLEYFSLIDNSTGDETDLLVEPSYTFKANSDEPSARFTLIFRKTTLETDEINVENNIFAYQNGSDIIVNGEGELQVFDVMGRLVMTTNVNGIETINVKSQGVYIFRLNGMTQKIVVR